MAKMALVVDDSTSMRQMVAFTLQSAGFEVIEGSDGKDALGKVNGKAVAQDRVPAAMSLHFTSNATFDIGTDLDSPVSLDYYEQAPFAFNGSIGATKIKYLKN